MESADQHQPDTTALLASGTAARTDSDLSALLAGITQPGELECRIVSGAELRDCAIWRSTFAASRKDHRYYEITEDTLRDWAVQNGLTKLWSSARGSDPKLHLRFKLDPLDLYVQHVHPLLNAGLQHVLKWMVPARYDETLKKFPNDAEIW